MSEKENPVIESPDIEQKPEAKTEQVDVESLMSTLEKFGAKDPKKLQGRLQNAEDYAMMRSERDRVMNELQAMRAEIAAQRQAPPPRQQIDEYSEGTPIDIESLVEKGVAKVLEREKRATFEHQKRMNDAWIKITGHSKYHLVKGEFEESLKDPATVMKLTSGQVDPMQFYYDLLIDKYDGVTKQTVEAFKQMKGATGVKPPHVEGQARVPQRGEAVPEKEKKIKELREKALKGRLTEGDQDELINTTLADFMNM